MTRLWMLRRIKELGGTLEDLLCVYTLQLRCVTEQACPAFNGSLTLNDITNLEKLQRTATKVILGEKFSSYKNALQFLELETLEKRRESICLNFATKTSKNPKFSAWFQKSKANPRNPSHPYTTKEYLETFARTAIYEKSPLLYLTRLLNNA